jgi:hypothetical protein
MKGDGKGKSTNGASRTGKTKSGERGREKTTNGERGTGKTTTILSEQFLLHGDTFPPTVSLLRCRPENLKSTQ